MTEIKATSPQVVRLAEIFSVMIKNTKDVVLKDFLEQILVLAGDPDDTITRKKAFTTVMGFIDSTIKTYNLLPKEEIKEEIDVNLIDYIDASSRIVKYLVTIKDRVFEKELAERKS